MIDVASFDRLDVVFAPLILADHLHKKEIRLHEQRTRIYARASNPLSREQASYLAGSASCCDARKFLLKRTCGPDFIGFLRFSHLVIERQAFELLCELDIVQSGDRVAQCDE